MGRITQRQRSVAVRPSIQFADIAGKYLAFAAPLCLLGAGLHEWAYLDGLGLTFNSLPLQLADLTRAAFAIFLPFCLIAVICLGLILYVEHRSNWSERNPTKEGWDTGDKVALAAGLLGPLLWLAFGDEHVGSLTVVASIWTILIGGILSRHTARLRFSRSVRLAILLAPMFILYCAASGYSGGRSELRRNEANATLALPGGSKPVTVLRAYEKGVLVKWHGQRYSLVRYEDVARIDYDRTGEGWRGLLCSIWPSLARCDGGRLRANS